ncbi:MULTISPECIES: YgiW/YdeI family stress tolerance OB fold protein [Hafnia]|uniref:TIGR00156 family protein n=1 Tax=Hafnia alvei ATCC 51873 TaxID=1002364 RepID=G9Y3F2_HAFAL|nr:MULTISPECIES: YgiW/YdeI family stress tolerance OB fold protein [Hafnia]AJR01967.1 Protein YgiW precursor [Enterobacteriaceae bacterium bta3-1]EHM45500.1 TIGR00156 family protein [Hafnia alvei ATCC 51873]OFS11336.1 TIGR00156 family protein [Hafnia sp. HMSC23F03]QQE42237.1 YgiW/YdeI family stress tolerance OB fold protein [Hafnia alvei]
MKKTAALLAILAVCSAPVLAQNGGFVDPNAPATQTTQTTQAAGGFNGPSAGTMTVEKAKTMSDDTWVTLRGNIEQRIGGDHYTFRDASGTMNVDIDHKRWNGQTITPKDTVELQGKIDKDWNSVELDVKQITKVK